MEPIIDMATYLRAHAQELGNRILQSYPPLHAIDDPPSPLINKLLREPYPAQTLAIMGLVRRWQQARAGAVIAECGTGKTLISLGAIYTHAEGCTRSHHSIGSADPGGGDTTPHVRYAT
jgi:superfamily II DNA or RNA helicase